MTYNVLMGTLNHTHSLTPMTIIKTPRFTPHICRHPGLPLLSKSVENQQNVESSAKSYVKDDNLFQTVMTKITKETVVYHIRRRTDGDGAGVDRIGSVSCKYGGRGGCRAMKLRNHTRVGHSILCHCCWSCSHLTAASVIWSHHTTTTVS